MEKNEAGLTISALEKELGIGKDTLRVWERRYGFPSPARDARGERRYPPDQVARLHLVRRLLDQGMRPHQVLALPPDALEACVRPAAPEVPGEAPGSEALLPLIRRHDPQALQDALRTMLMKDGLQRFVLDKAAPLVEAIGRWWERGEIEVFEEHLVTEQLYRVLREAVSQIAPGEARPRILITTLPNEPHALGLLLAEAVMCLEGAHCTPLGAQTPESQIVAGAQAGNADIVALSFSRYYSAASLRQAITRLHTALPANVELWCGGAGAAQLRRAPEGVHVIAGLRDIEPQLARWRAAGGPVDRH